MDKIYHKKTVDGETLVKVNLTKIYGKGYEPTERDVTLFVEELLWGRRDNYEQGIRTKDIRDTWE